MATHDELQATIHYRFTRPELLDEATLAAGASISCKDVEGDIKGNKPLALIGDALIRLDVAVRSYARGTGIRKH
jgi:ribonuclease-3